MSKSILVTVEPCRDVRLRNFCKLTWLLKSTQTGGVVLQKFQPVNHWAPEREEAAASWASSLKTNFTARRLLTHTFNGAVDAAVVSSFGHLEHPCPQQVLIGAVGRRVTPTASNQEEGNAAAQQQRAAQLHCHSGGFTHCQAVSQPTNQACVCSGEALKFDPVSCTSTSLLAVPHAETLYI